MDGTRRTGSSDYQPHTCSTSPLIYQPLPRRNGLAPVLQFQSNNSEDGGSAIAQVGKRNVLTASQKQEDALFRILASPSVSNGDRGSSDAEIGQPISPGISEIPPPVVPPVSKTSNKGIPTRNHVDVPRPECLRREHSSSGPSSFTTLGPPHSATKKDLHSLGQDLTSPRDIRVLKGRSLLRLASSQDGPTDQGAISPQPNGANSVIHSERPKNDFGEDLPSINNAGTHPSAIKGQRESKTRECQPTGRASPHLSNEDDIWKKYVCSDSDYDEIEDTALEDAIHGAARYLRPSDPLDEVVDDRLTAPCGNQGTTSLATLAPVSETSGDAMEDHLLANGRQPTSQHLLARPERDSASTNTGHGFRTNRVAPPCSLVEMAQSAQFYTATESTPDPRVAEPEPSNAASELKGNFRFSAPKLFVGKLAGATAVPQQELTRGKVGALERKRGRPRKKMRPGRTDIRAMPDYTEDPIEEFDRVDLRRLPPPSFFGPLETD